MGRNSLNNGPPAGATAENRIVEVEDQVRVRVDSVAVEEPLEIRVVAGEGSRRRGHSVAITMRTPGHDFELAAGFLFSEGLVLRREDIWRFSRCGDAAEEAAENIVEVHLGPGVPFDISRFSRHVYTTSSCGVCGKASIELLQALQPSKPEGAFQLSDATVRSLPTKLAHAQEVFSETGGLHASGLFDPRGELLLAREDVGRHNALDKIIGASLLEGKLPLSDTVLLVSGRSSFELVQKALMAGIPALFAVGAPSSLAVDTAVEFGMTLVGFLRRERFNVYSGSDRLDLSGLEI
jgi:FdhD protein